MLRAVLEAAIRRKVDASDWGMRSGRRPPELATTLLPPLAVFLRPPEVGVAAALGVQANGGGRHPQAWPLDGAVGELPGMGPELATAGVAHLALYGVTAGTPASTECPPAVADGIARLSVGCTSGALSALP